MWPLQRGAAPEVSSARAWQGCFCPTHEAPKPLLKASQKPCPGFGALTTPGSQSDSQLYRVHFTLWSPLKRVFHWDALSPGREMVNSMSSSSNAKGDACYSLGTRQDEEHMAILAPVQ